MNNSNLRDEISNRDSRKVDAKSLDRLKYYGLQDNNLFLKVSLFFKFIKEDFQKNESMCDVNHSSFIDFYNELPQNYMFNNIEKYYTIMKNNNTPYLIQQEKENTISKAIEFENIFGISLFDESCDVSLMTDEVRKKYEAEKNKLLSKLKKFGDISTDLNIIYNEYNSVGTRKNLTNLDNLPESFFEKFLENYSDKNENLTEEENVYYLLDRYNNLINAIKQDLNAQIETKYCHTKFELPFIKYFETDLLRISNKINLTYSYFYFINTVSDKNKSYGIYLYIKFDKPYVIFYIPDVGIKKYNYRNLSSFKKDFNSVINNYGENYFSFRVKIKPQMTQTIPFSSLETNLSIIRESSHQYKVFVNKKNKLFLNSIESTENIFVEKIRNKFKLKGFNKTDLFINFAIELRKVSDLISINKYNLSSKSYWMYFLVKYLEKNEDFSKKKLNELNFCFPPIKVHEFVEELFNRSAHNICYEKNKIISLIFYTVIKNIMKNNFLLQFEIAFKSIKSSTFKEFPNLFFRNFYIDKNMTFKEWNRCHIVYNQTYISRSFNNSSSEFKSIKEILNLERYKKFTSRDPNPELEKLKNHMKHFLSAKDEKLYKFCISFINQNNIFSLVAVLLEFCFKNKKNISLSINCYFLSIIDVSPHVYEFVSVYCIDGFTSINDPSAMKKLFMKNDPSLTNVVFNEMIYFSSKFILELKNDRYDTKNFDVGFLEFNKKNNESSDKLMVKNIIKEFFNSKYIEQYLSGNKNPNHQSVFYQA
ncbi:hypothetical protein [Silvanigrella aquatica]|uniref:Uncharacterized protein n=1 Tax=Silvanigrella aquatica TaxID=1915309 RepID=A0A1L4CYH3_9BACT|nr:hypothetical protein [Silvanigrella aquatica]APJ03002.1 hypothetical protein AXG55_03360 [Silvanigrella aquatica]